MRPVATTRSATGIPTGRLAVWWLIASEIVLFGGLLSSYIMYRLSHDNWSAQAANTNTLAGAFNTLVLLTSSLTAVLAHKAVDEGDPKKAFRFLWLTILGACTFLTVKAFEWAHEIHEGYTLTSSTFWSFYYCAAGLHAAHVVAGAVVMAIISIDVRKGLELQRVELAGIYWHFVDLVWIFLFPLLYIAK